MSGRWLAGVLALALCVSALSGVRVAGAQEVAPVPAEVPVAPAADFVPEVTVPAAPTPPTQSLVASPSSASEAPVPARVPIARRWWFWAGLGAAAVGVVVAGIALSPRQPYSGNAQPGITSPF